MIVMGLYFIIAAYIMAFYQNRFDDKIALGFIIFALIFSGTLMIVSQIKDFYIERKFKSALNHFRMRNLESKYMNKFPQPCPCGDIFCEKEPEHWPYSHFQ